MYIYIKFRIHIIYFKISVGKIRCHTVELSLFQLTIWRRTASQVNEGFPLLLIPGVSVECFLRTKDPRTKHSF